MSYSGYVFSSYAIAALVLAGLAVASLRDYVRLKRAEADRRAGADG
ncbi:MAG: heme exporter protein CcmD [Parvibaculales bacterium]